MRESSRALSLPGNSTLPSSCVACLGGTVRLTLAFMLRYSSFGVAAALLHLAILGYTAALILGSADPYWSRYWFIFLALDFPVSLGVIPVNWLVPPAGGGPLRDLTNFWWPLLYHGIVGTGWWYIVGWAIERKVRRRETPSDDDQAKDGND